MPIHTDNRTVLGLLLILLHIQHGQIGKVSILLLVIKSIPNHILIGNIEPHVIDGDVDGPSIGLTQQSTDFDRAGFLLRQGLDQILNGQSGVDDILNQQDIFAFDILCQFSDIFTLPDVFARDP